MIGANWVFVKRSPEISLTNAFVRGYFVKKLVATVKQVLRANGLSGIETVKGGGRLYVFAKKGQDLEKVAVLLSGVFGVQAVALCRRVSSQNVSEIRSSALQVALDCLGGVKSFAVRLKNSGEKKVSSQKFEVDLGSQILSKMPGLKVDLKNPEKKISVEIGPKGSFVFAEEIPGFSGLPLGVEGNVAIFFEGKKEELLAAFLVMKRGCNIFPVLARDSAELKAHVNKLVARNSFRQFKFSLESDLLGLVAAPDIAVKALVRSDESFSKNLAVQKENCPVPVFWPLVFFPKELEKNHQEVLN